MVKIVVAEPCPLVSRGLKSILRSSQLWKVSGVARTTVELLRLLKTRRVDLLMFDPQVVGEKNDRLTFIQEMLANLPGISILLYASDDAVDAVIAALRAGANGCVHKNSPEKIVVTALRTVIAGQKYIDEVLQRRLALLHLERKQGDSPTALLSHRERAVLAGIIEGKKLTSIASELSISAKTVTSYRARMLQKLSAKSNADLIRVGLQQSGPDLRQVQRSC